MSSVEEYTILIRNGERLLTASDLRLSITIMGKQANQTAGPFSLHSPRSLVERHHGDANEVHSGFDATKDIGDIIAIRLQAKSGWRPFLSSIYINHIRVRQPSRGRDCFFPVYSWINANETRIFFCGSAQLPNDPNVSAYMKTLRGTDLAYWQSVYDSSKLVRLPNLPVGMAERYTDLPYDEQFLSIKARQIFGAILQDIVDTSVSKVIGKTKSWDNYDEMKKQFFKNGRLPTPIADVWEQDATMGRCFVSGLNPYLMKLCVDGFPKGFPISKENIKANVPLLRNRNMADDFQRGHFCYLDFRPLLGNLVELQNQYRLGIKKRPSEDMGFIKSMLTWVTGGSDLDNLDSRHLAAPVCVLYWDAKSKSIVPVAIQLKRDGKIYYPCDSNSTEVQQNEWQLAKMWVCSADTQVHQLRTHFFRTHMITECFALAMRRSLSPAHPLFRLLKPHLQNVMAMNALARQRLLPLICKLFSLGQESFSFLEKCFELWSFDDMNPKTELRNNGFGENANTPFVKEPGVYPWREDVLDIWNAIEEYVTAFVSIFYLPGQAEKETSTHGVVGHDSSFEKDIDSKPRPPKSDLQRKNHLVMNDTELNHFRLELLDLIPGKSFQEFESVNDVIQLLTGVIYTASAGHSAINFNQYEHYAWQPHHPMIMRLPIPEEISEPISERVILDSIPNITQTVQAVAISRALSEYSADEVYLGKLSDQDLLHNDPQARVIFDTLNHRLDEVTSKIKERNATGMRKKHPYVYLLPSMIPSSVAV